MALGCIRVVGELKRGASRLVHLDETSPSRVVLLADAAEIPVVLRLHELLSRLAALANQFPGVGFELLELVELRVGVVGERVGVDGGVLAAGRFGVALGRRVVVVLPHLGHPRRLVHGGFHVQCPVS